MEPQNQPTNQKITPNTSDYECQPTHSIYEQNKESLTSCRWYDFRQLRPHLHEFQYL